MSYLGMYFFTKLDDLQYFWGCAGSITLFLVAALKYYAKADWWNDAIDDDDNLYKKGAFENYGYLQAQQALKEIENEI